MAESDINPRTEEIRKALQALIATGDSAKVDYLASVLERAIVDQRNEAEAEAQRKADTFVPIPNLTIESEMDYYDAISQRLNQAKGIADLMGACDGTAEDASLPNAAWAVRQLLDEADELASRAILKH